MGNTEKRDRLELEGLIVESRKGIFLVKVNENLTVKATLSGKVRTNGIRLLVGDRVIVEVSPYSCDSGRVIYRFKS